jgi:hypothetical protein
MFIELLMLTVMAEESQLFLRLILWPPACYYLCNFMQIRVCTEDGLLKIFSAPQPLVGPSVMLVHLHKIMLGV